jgi:hypothetical protein
MKTLIAAALCAALAAVPAAAVAKPRAKVYRGTFEAVGSDGAYTDGRFGTVQLVDGRHNDKLSVHVRHLGARTRYVFRLQQADTACEEGAAGGTDVPDWRYRRGGALRTSRKGNANSWARSHSFSAHPGTEYFVGVYAATPTGDPGDIVLCARLTTKRAKGGHKPKKPGKRGGAPGRSGDRPGKSGGAPGRSGDRPGKSGDAPGRSGDHSGQGPKQPGGKHPHAVRAEVSRKVLR